MNKALIDTDILSEIGKGVDPKAEPILIVSHPLSGNLASFPADFNLMSSGGILFLEGSRTG